MKSPKAGFGKNTETNKRLLDELIQLADEYSNQGIKYAEEAGDQATADRIRNLRDIQIGDQASSPEVAEPEPGMPEAGYEEGGYRFKGGDPADPSNWEKM